MGGGVVCVCVLREQVVDCKGGILSQAANRFALSSPATGATTRAQEG